MFHLVLQCEASPLGLSQSLDPLPTLLYSSTLALNPVASNQQDKYNPTQKEFQEKVTGIPKGWERVTKITKEIMIGRVKGLMILMLARLQMETMKDLDWKTKKEIRRGRGKEREIAISWVKEIMIMKCWPRVIRMLILIMTD